MDKSSHYQSADIAIFNHKGISEASVVNIAKKVWTHPFYFIAFGFGSGLIPIAPGTWGTLAAIPIYILLANAPMSFYLIAVLIAFAVGIYICHHVSHDLGVHDYSGIVWDEIVGYLLTMFHAPFSLFWMSVGFLLFRVFDIWKPQPIRWFDRHVQGGLGIMLDDVLAAIPAWILLQVLVWLLK